MAILLQWFFRFWNVNVNVPWTHRERFRLFVRKRYSVTTRKFRGVPDRFWPFLKRSETLRDGHGNGQGRWTVWNDHTVQDKRSETIAKSSSRFKNERITVFISGTKIHTPDKKMCFFLIFCAFFHFWPKKSYKLG